LIVLELLAPVTFNSNKGSTTVKLFCILFQQ
jgi:hypothetical protein